MGRASNPRFVSTSQLASATGVTLSTIHYYTALGLLRTHRWVGNNCLYGFREAKARLRRIARLRHEGYSLTLIRKILSKARKYK